MAKQNCRILVCFMGFWNNWPYFLKADAAQNVTVNGERYRLMVYDLLHNFQHSLTMSGRVHVPLTINRKSMVVNED